MPKLSDKQKASSPDYPSLARKLLEASEEMAPSKLSQGLYVVATPIGHLGDISMRALWTLATADGIACEDTRTSGGMLNKYGIKAHLIPYHDHNASKQRPALLKRLVDGESIALISDAGMPLISDPGFDLVRACREENIPVTVIPGANAAVTALAGSGLPGNRFLFIGFLPPKAAARQKALQTLTDVPVTMIFYEAPQRLADMLKDCVAILGGEREATVARELTKLYEEQRRGNLQELAAFYAAQEPKGEITLIIAPATAIEPSEHDIDGLLKSYLKDLSVRDAVAEVTALTGLKKADIYTRALKLAKDTAKT